MKIGIICAMQKEYGYLYKHLYNKWTLPNSTIRATTEMNGGNIVYITMSGIGKVNASNAAQWLINLGATRILSVGVAGGANENVKVGDVVFGDSFCYYDVWCGEPNLPGQIQGLPPKFEFKLEDVYQKMPTNSHRGTIATGDWFVQTKEKVDAIKAYLPKTYDLVAIDMESAAIAQICHKWQVQFASIRIISDNPLLPNQNEQYDDFWNYQAEKSFDILKNIIK